MRNSMYAQHVFRLVIFMRHNVIQSSLVGVVQDMVGLGYQADLVWWLHFQTRWFPTPKGDQTHWLDRATLPCRFDGSYSVPHCISGLCPSMPVVE